MELQFSAFHNIKKNEKTKTKKKQKNKNKNKKKNNKKRQVWLLNISTGLTGS